MVRPPLPRAPMTGWTLLSAAALALLCAGSAARAQAAEGTRAYWSDTWRGWHFYEAPEPAPPKARPPERPPQPGPRPIDTHTGASKGQAP